jgi:hypothetical protein
MLDDSGRDAFCKLAANVQTYVSQASDKKHSAWIMWDRTGPEPTRPSVEIEFFGQSDNRIAMGLGKGHGRVWTQLLRANVYPEIAHLHLNKSAKEEDLAHDGVNRHGDEACQIVVKRLAQQDHRDYIPDWWHGT